METITRCSCGSIRCTNFWDAVGNDRASLPVECRGEPSEVIILDGSETKERAYKALAGLVLKQNKYNITHSASSLGVSVRTLQRNTKAWAIQALSLNGVQ